MRASHLLGIVVAAVQQNVCEPQETIDTVRCLLDEDDRQERACPLQNKRMEWQR